MNVLSFVSAKRLILYREMNWDKMDPYQYHPERGLYYHEISADVICGSQPRTAYDIDLIKDKIGATDIVSLQQDKDLEYWGVNLEELRQQACNVDLTYRRCPVRELVLLKSELLMSNLLSISRHLKCVPLHCLPCAVSLASDLHLIYRG